MNFKTTVVVLTLSALTLSTLTYAYAASLLDAKKSSVTITAKQMSVPMSAKFNKVSGTVDYNPAAPDATKASVDIDIASFDLGDPEYNKEVLKKDWFNAPQFPKASFVSTSIKTGASGSMTATGNLTIKGKTQAVTFPVKISKEGAATTFDGSLPIHRLAYNIGEGDWADTSMVADEVVIKFHVVVAP
jgi:polyisoprenoid-binding protein YceI